MKIKDRIAKLIDIKSIVTLSLTAVFCKLSIDGAISADNFMTVFTVIISFFFGVQLEKHSNTNSSSGEDNEKGRYEK